MLADLSLEAGTRLDEEPDSEPAQPLGERRPLAGRNTTPQWGTGHAMAIDEIEMSSDRARLAEGGIQVADELMTVKVEVDPVDIAAALRAS